MKPECESLIRFVQNSEVRRLRLIPGTNLAGLVLALGLLFGAARASAQSVPAAHVRHGAKPRAATPVAAQPAPTPAAQPPQPDWPVNNPPGQPTVTWNADGLRIEATNSSLRQILNDVATTTGAKLEGLGKDERIFGAFGPAPARDVLSQLLHGTGYNVLMLGDLGQGTPREIVLSARNASGPANAQPRPVGQNSDEDEQPEQPEQPEDQQPQPVQPQIIRGPMNGPPNMPNQQITPQERLQQMQQQQLEMQRQQQEQLRQMQQNQQNQPQ